MNSPQSQKGTVGASVVRSVAKATRKIKVAVMLSPALPRWAVRKLPVAFLLQMRCLINAEALLRGRRGMDLFSPQRGKGLLGGIAQSSGVHQESPTEVGEAFAALFLRYGL